MCVALWERGADADCIEFRIKASNTEPHTKLPVSDRLSISALFSFPCGLYICFGDFFLWTTVPFSFFFSFSPASLWSWKFWWIRPVWSCYFFFVFFGFCLRSTWRKTWMNVRVRRSELFSKRTLRTRSKLLALRLAKHWSFYHHRIHSFSHLCAV